MTQLYLISPSNFNLSEFRKSLEAALSTNNFPIYGGTQGEGSLNKYTLPPSNAYAFDPPVNGGDNAASFIGAFQLRLKNADDAQIISAAKELLPICREYGVAFIMNDRADLCAELQLDGVHVGQEDLEKQSIKEIQQIIGNDAVIGVTCHASTHLAMEAAEAGADYVAFGAFYETTSKPREKLEKWGTPEPEILKSWSTFTTIPCVAIGGITPQNAKPLIDAGADFLAVITAVWSNPAGPAEAVKQFKRLVE